MRMDTDAPWSADDVVNGYAEADLARVIREHGDERFANRIAAAIVAARPIETTTRLAEVVTSAIPAPARRTGGHPAKRTFQAIRIEVNGELDALPDALDKAIDALVPGGRLAVLSYHSGEDRIVKERIRFAETGGCECPPELPCVCGAVQTVRVVRKVPKRPSAAEQDDQPPRELRPPAGRREDRHDRHREDPLMGVPLRTADRRRTPAVRTRAVAPTSGAERRRAADRRGARASPRRLVHGRRSPCWWAA